MTQRIPATPPPATRGGGGSHDTGSASASGHRLSAATGAARSFLAQRPLASLLVAAGAGALAGWLVKR